MIFYNIYRYLILSRYYLLSLWLLDCGFLCSQNKFKYLINILKNIVLLKIYMSNYILIHYINYI